jgi:subtilase family serine protease
MRMLSRIIAVLVLGYFCSALMAQVHAPTVRIVERIDESSLAALKGNTHPAANPKNDQGKVSDNLPMTDLILVLSRDSAQQAAFETFVASQYDPKSPNFHQWLTPEQVGENFGPAETDVATISNWLTGHGFSITQVSKDRMSIRFNGTAAQVASTFHTEIHNLLVNGKRHIGNMSDPQIPTALAPVVTGVKSLHNFFPRPLHRLGSQVTRDPGTGIWKRIAGTSPAGATAKAAVRAVTGVRSSAAEAGKADLAAKPQFGISIGGTDPYLVEDVAPFDFATIYNVLPLWNASTPIDGTGQTIAIAGTSDIEVGQTGETGTNGNNDIATFRTFFGLPTGNAVNTPKRISGNSQALTVCSAPMPSSTDDLCDVDDELENSLDVEWSGAVAKNAQIILVASYPASASDDSLYDSESYIVNNLTARIMNVSYGACELANGTAGNVQYYNLWQTAAAEGIAVFVASGDSGAASCDQGGDDGGEELPYPAEHGLTVSGLASTPYNTAVGGTDFNWCSLTATTECTASPYWSSTNSASAGQSSALGYVPEVPWNDTCTSSLALGWLEQNFSGVTDAESGCNAIVVNAQSLNQQGYGDVLYLVDTVGGSGGASNCVVNSTSPTGTTVGTCTAGATSTGSTSNPDTGAAQGSLTVYNNGWPKPAWQTGVSGIPSDGVRDLPDVSFFASDGFLSSSAYLVCVSDISPCAYDAKGAEAAQEVGGTSVATPAMAGVMALINQKAGADQGSPNAELYKLATKQTYSACSAESVKASSTSCYFNDIDSGTNAMACDYDAYVNTPSPNCTLLHSSDYVGVLPGYSAGVGYDLATGLGSLNVANVVNAWPATVGTTAASVTVKPAQTSINSNNSLDVTATVSSTAAGGAQPTGTVTLTVSGSTYSASGTISGSGTYTFTIPANSLPAGNDTLTVSYGGDVTYAPVSNTAQVTVAVVVLLTPTVMVTPAAATLDSNASLNVTVTVGGSSISPTGTVQLLGGGFSSTSQLLVNGSYQFTIPANTLSSGKVTLTANYSGDANYAAGSNTATVTVTSSTFSLTKTAIAVTPTAGISPGASATATVTITSIGGYAGTVTLTCQESSSTATGGDDATCAGGSTGVTLTSTTTSGTVTFTIGTTAPVTAALKYPKEDGKGWIGAGSGAILALLVFIGIPARRRSLRQFLGILVAMVALGTMAGCGGASSSNGGSGNSDPGTLPGTYTFSVVATGSPSVTPTVATTFTVTVN